MPSALTPLIVFEFPCPIGKRKSRPEAAQNAFAAFDFIPYSQRSIERRI
jgi:hypothetical protein